MKVTIALLLISISGALCNFHRGDFVQTSRRGQFHQHRTTWHDLQGRHCPRFGIDSVVAIPIPKPKEYDELEQYKIQLAFDHERLFSSWLAIIDYPGAAGSVVDKFHSHKLSTEVLVPKVVVELYKRDDVLLKIRVGSYRLPEIFLKSHPDVVEEYKNASHWPKHVVVQYMWKSLDEVDAERGQTFIVYGGVLFIFCMIVGVSMSSHEKLTELIRELASDAGSSSREEEKAE